MVSLEQVKLLETKVAKAIDFVNRITDENTLLKGKLETCRKRIDELEGLVQRFKDEQGRIEEGILSALDRLNQFEDAVGAAIGAAVGDATGRNPSPARAAEKAAPEKKTQEEEVTASPEESGSASGDDGPEEAQTPPSFGEPPPGEDESEEAIMAALEAEEAAAKAERDSPLPGEHTDSAELDIF
jgi:chromosome segregation ATPase